jgi:hypothetical protein
MVSTPIVSTQDGPRLTVSMMLKSPTLIPKRVLSMLDNAFLVDSLLRNAEDAPSGMVSTSRARRCSRRTTRPSSTSSARSPRPTAPSGTPKVARVVRRAFGLRVSKTMIDRNSSDAVNVQVVQIKNTMIRAWEDAFFSAVVANASVQVVQTDQSWQSASSHIRQDVNSAKYLISVAAADTAGKQKFGYKADTLVISPRPRSTSSTPTRSAPYVGNIADENLLYTGKLPNKFLGLDVLVSWRLSAYFPSGAIVCQRKVFGGISDERPCRPRRCTARAAGPTVARPSPSARTSPAPRRSSSTSPRRSCSSRVSTVAPTPTASAVAA